MNRRNFLAGLSLTGAAGSLPLCYFGDDAGATLPFSPASAVPESANPSPLLVWYRQPADKWIDAMPLGNGHLGAMVFGGVDFERIGLNEDTLWSGGPYQPAPDVGPNTLKTIRDLVFTGRAKQAQDLADKTMMGNPRHQTSYQTIGELQLASQHVVGATDYRRQLDLATAISTVTFSADGVHFTREYFASPVSRLIVIRLTADRPGMIAFDAGFKSPQVSHTQVDSPDGLRLIGQNGAFRVDNRDLADLKFESRIKVLHEGGSVAVSNKSGLSVKDADAVTILIAAATSYVSFKDTGGNPSARCEHDLKNASSKTFPQLRAEHIAEHQRIFSRVQLSFGDAKTNNSTDERLQQFTLDGDPAFAALYFQFGRYLLLSSSRKGGQPANLQGIWNQDQSASWGGKYTVNINTEMNYWPSYPTNMAECDEPLFAMVQDLTVTGAVTARKIYRARGWVCHHNTDLWRATAPIDSAFYGLWPTGGAWLCNQLFERYAFTLDKSYLSRLYPMMKGSALFFTDTLVEDPNTKFLVTCPSMSPEHDWQWGISMVAGPTMDMQILDQLFGNCIDAASALKVDNADIEEWTKTRARLAPLKIGKAGQLQEWQDDVDTTNREKNHRHLSPLYGLFPGHQITDSDPKLMAGAKKLLEMRTDTNGMGWAIAWRLNCWARLQDPVHTAAVLQDLIATHTEHNLFDRPSVQLDGNFGGTSGMTEMLLQSHDGSIHLLPALPAALKNGRASGLLARGGFTVAFSWQDGQLQNVSLSSLRGGDATVRYGSLKRHVTVRAGKTVELNGDLLGQFSSTA